MDRRSKKAQACNLEFCHGCTICAAKCPVEAIEIIRDGKDEKKKDES